MATSGPARQWPDWTHPGGCQRGPNPCSGGGSLSHTAPQSAMMVFMSPTSPRRPATSADAGNRRTEVRDVAANLFLRNGFAATTMNDIAAAAGIHPGSLYHHFASKEEIAVELVGAFNDDLTALIAETKRLTGIGTPERRFRDLAARLAEFGMRHAAAVRLRGYQPPSTTTERLATVLDFDEHELVAVWRDAAEAAVASADPPADAGLLRFAVAHLVIDSGTTYSPGTDVRPVTALLCDLFLHGLAVDAPSDAELDASSPMKVAIETVAGWSSSTSDETDDRASILAAARSEFARRGYAATTIRGISQAAEVRMATMYRRVSSKEAMLTEILGTYSQILNSGVAAVIETEGSEVERLDAVMYLLTNATRRFAEETSIVKFGWNGREPGAGPFQTYSEQTQGRLSLLEGVLARGLDQGAIRPLGASSELALLVRRILWLPYGDFEDSDSARTHAFLRRSLLRPTLT